MRIEQLEYLIEIAKTNSISIAAENLYVSQPSISEAIKKLEGELGIKLLERTKTGSYLTPIGKSIAEQAVRVIEETAKVHQLVAEHQKNEPLTVSGDLSIYTVPSVGNNILPHALDAFHEQYPQVAFNVFSSNTFQTIPSVKTQACQIGIITLTDAEDPRQLLDGLQQELLMTERLYLEVSTSSPLAAKKSISLKEVACLPLATPAYHSDDNMWQQTLFKNIPSANIVLKTSNNELIRQKVKAGQVNTIVLSSSLSHSHEGVCFLPIRCSLKPKLYAIYAPDDPQLALIQLFLQTLKTFF